MAEKKQEEEFFAHFPADISETIHDYIRDKVLIGSRYLFTSREGKRQYAYCTHCRQEHESNGLKHGTSDRCPHCKSLTQVKAGGRGRKKLVDEAYLLWYEKSRVNPEAIIARGFYLKRDYTKDYRKTETSIKPIAMYLFEWGKGGKMMHRNYWWETTPWAWCNSVYSAAVNTMNRKPSYWAPDSVMEAVNGTPFQYCTWEQYDIADRVEVFDLAARYKSIEFLTKIGLGPIVVSKLTGQATYNAINWNGQSPEKVLRLTKSEIKEMRKAGGIGARTLRHYQISKKEGSNLSWSEARELSDLIEKNVSKELDGLLRYAPIAVIKHYFLKQMRHNKGRAYGSGRNVLYDWRDYLAECKELGMDLTQDYILFPNNLHAAHQKTTEKVKIKADETLNKQIAKRVKELNKFKFEFNGLLIRPAVSSAELFEEGKALKHCVGMYSKRYAEGQINLFVIRQVANQEEPFYTMEVQGGKIVQCRGFENCNMTPEVKAFVETFISKKMPSKKRSRIDVTNLNRQEVAI